VTGFGSSTLNVGSVSVSENANNFLYDVYSEAFSATGFWFEISDTSLPKNSQIKVTVNSNYFDSGWDAGGAYSYLTIGDKQGNTDNVISYDSSTSDYTVEGTYINYTVPVPCYFCGNPSVNIGNYANDNLLYLATITASGNVTQTVELSTDTPYYVSVESYAAGGGGFEGPIPGGECGADAIGCGSISMPTYWPGIASADIGATLTAPGATFSLTTPPTPPPAPPSTPETSTWVMMGLGFAALLAQRTIVSRRTTWRSVLSGCSPGYLRMKSTKARRGAGMLRLG
jgi:hypothetical protein